MILKIGVCHHAGWMRIRMENLEALTSARITEFLSGSAGIDFTGQSRAERYTWLQATLMEQRYFSLGKKERGAVRALMSNREITSVAVAYSRQSLMQSVQLAVTITLFPSI